MKSIDERVADLIGHLPDRTKIRGVGDFIVMLRLALLEVARDQRHASAEAVLAAHQSNRRGDLMDVDDAHQAVMNAAIQGELEAKAGKRPK